MIEGHVWKTSSTTYTLQIKFKSNTEFKQLDPFLKDWKQIGSGFNKKGEILNLFAKEIEDPGSWSSFARKLPIPLFEWDRDGNKKTVKTAVTTRKTKKSFKQKQNSAMIGGRTCGKCGNKGHNSRTCKG